jgi:DNA invertase Pin-like site-specific DNA recombinase
MQQETVVQHVAIYLRVSSKRQDLRSQKPDLERWAAAQDRPVKWYSDKFTGKTMDRPGWKALEADIQAGRVAALVVWRLDRLGRTAKGLTGLFDDLLRRKINLVSMKDGLDLSTPAGRLLANMLASIAQFEGEIRVERILAGQAAARAAGKVLGGGKPGRRIRLSQEKEQAIRQLRREGKAIAEIARIVELSRPTVYKAIG